MTAPGPREHTVELLRVDDGQQLLSATAIAILVGAPAEAVQQWRNHADSPESLPPEWQQSGRRRSREAMAATGSSHVGDALHYWADREHRGRVWQQPDGSLWLLIS